MKRVLNYILLVTFFIAASSAYSNENSTSIEKRWYVPDYVKAQFAGNIGFISVGAGYNLLSNLIQVEILYGYVPSSIGGSTIHTLAQKNSILIYDLKTTNYIIIPYAGFTTNLEMGGNSDGFFSEKYGDGYYKTNAIHFTFFIGGKIYHQLSYKSNFKGLDIFAEIGTVDMYLWYVINSKNVELSEIFSLALGFNLYI
ncbi:MAG: hypothetical protein HZB59_09800 [Ignavibacteriales bacterium]|nr:hypothetical protein [Ignavibacteriales bacterium]